jgi:hypothetical protein
VPDPCGVRAFDNEPSKNGSDLTARARDRGGLAAARSSSAWASGARRSTASGGSRPAAMYSPGSSAEGGPCPGQYRETYDQNLTGPRQLPLSGHDASRLDNRRMGSYGLYSRQQWALRDAPLLAGPLSEVAEQPGTWLTECPGTWLTLSLREGAPVMVRSLKRPRSVS